MPSTAKQSPIKIVADISNVSEVSLLGMADLAYWTDRLRPAALEPTPLEGKAQILVIAAQLKFMGFRFNEISFSVLCRSTRATNIANPLSQIESQEGSFLLRAFNSNRFFAWSERVFFSTPYYYADCRVEKNAPASIELNQKDKLCFSAKMGSHHLREAIRNAEEGWHGPVFLPNLKSIDQNHETDPLNAHKYFVAEILGPTQVFSFSQETDKIEIDTSADIPFLNELVKSNFAGHQWHIRTGARHAKSKTYTRQS